MPLSHGAFEAVSPEWTLQGYGFEIGKCQGSALAIKPSYHPPIGPETEQPEGHYASLPIVLETMHRPP